MAQKQINDLAADRLFSALRCLELQARLLLIASAVKGFQLQAEDVRCIGALLVENISKIKLAITEVK